MEPVLLVVRNKNKVLGASSILMNPLLSKQRKQKEQIGRPTVKESEVGRIYLKMPKNSPFKDAIDFARIGKETHRALKPKKPINNKHYKRQVNKIKKGWR